ncbi:MAG: histidinol-phosphatase HisJ [Candidatus Omnitrophica bacterium]|nr:histidinol-phosphatase HisJ [Candidatus Omnitrophota bacterium]
MPIPVVDYHMHTPLCGHAVGEPREYAMRAFEAGLTEIGFSDHAPMFAYADPKIAMRMDQLPTYHKMIEDVRKQFEKKLTVKVALEADFIVGHEEDTRKFLSAYRYDYVIGSVHFIGAWGFDNPNDRTAWNGKNIDQVYRDYYKLLRLSAQSKLFDIMGHVDLVKKFGARPASDMTTEIMATAEIFKACGVAVEINTAGLRKPVNEMYPSLKALEIYCQEGIPLTFGSDAHNPKEVGADFDKALELARAAGYQEYVTFKNRKIERKIGL